MHKKRSLPGARQRLGLRQTCLSITHIFRALVPRLQPGNVPVFEAPASSSVHTQTAPWSISFSHPVGRTKLRITTRRLEPPGKGVPRQEPGNESHGLSPSTHYEKLDYGRCVDPKGSAGLLPASAGILVLACW